MFLMNFAVEKVTELCEVENCRYSKMCIAIRRYVSTINVKSTGVRRAGVIIESSGLTLMIKWDDDVYSRKLCCAVT